MSTIRRGQVHICQKLNILQPSDFTVSHACRAVVRSLAKPLLALIAPGFFACVAELGSGEMPSAVQVVPLAVVQSSADRPTLVMVLPDPPAPETRWDGAFRFRAGAVIADADVVWVPTMQVLVLQPFDPLRTNLQWMLESGENTVLTRHGREVRLVDDSYELAQAAALPIVADPRPSVAPSADTVAETLRLRCGSCHSGDGPLTSLDVQSLFTLSSSSDGLRLVEPFRPEASVLLHRILPGYPLNGVQQSMPPAWSDVPPMTEEELRQIESWILLGAPE
jgi:hypothetical protein